MYREFLDFTRFSRIPIFRFSDRFLKVYERRKVPKDDPLWDSLVQGDVEKQLEEGIFEWQHGGYEYLVEIKDRYEYTYLSKKKRKNIHE